MDQTHSKKSLEYFNLGFWIFDKNHDFHQKNPLLVIFFFEIIIFSSPKWYFYFKPNRALENKLRDAYKYIDYHLMSSLPWALPNPVIAGGYLSVAAMWTPYRPRWCTAKSWMLPPCFWREIAPIISKSVIWWIFGSYESFLNLYCKFFVMNSIAACD